MPEPAWRPTAGISKPACTHWKWSEREQHLAALKAGFTKPPRRRKHIHSSLFLTLRGCWLLLLKGSKLCVLPPHTGSTFFKTIYLIWTASQRISFVLESFPEQQPHYEGVFKQMPPASASVSDNKTFSAWNIMAWLWWFIRGAWHLLLSSLHSIILQSVNRWGWLPPPWNQWHCRWKRTVVCQNLGTSQHYGLLKTIGISPAGKKNKRFNCLMWLSDISFTSPKYSCFTSGEQFFLWIYKGAMPVPRKPGLSDRAIQVLQTETGKWNLEKEGTQKSPSPLLT